MFEILFKDFSKNKMVVEINKTCINVFKVKQVIV